MKIFRIIFVGIFCTMFMGSIFGAHANDVNQTIIELQQKISELQSQENTLSKQIELLNSQITLTTLKIDSTKAAVTKLSSEIDELANEIDRIEALLTKRSELVLHRIPAAYKRQRIPIVGSLLFSNNFSDLVERIKYVSKIQEQDVELLFQLKATQNNFGERKNLREEKKQKQEQLKKQLEQQTIELDRQKREKQTLLSQTKNDETVYQKLLSQALAEKQALERALVDAVKVGPVNKGDPIALVGNTGYPGCSSGAHLHFEVRRNGTWTDPAEFLSSKTIVDEQNGGTWTTGNGNWDWPLSDPIRITQHYGKTPYSWRYAYSGQIHTGYDMVSASDVIRAPKEGTLYSSSEPCGGSSIINIKYIDHGGGIVSFYLHVQ